MCFELPSDNNYMNMEEDPLPHSEVYENMMHVTRILSIFKFSYHVEHFALRISVLTEL